MSWKGPYKLSWSSLDEYEKCPQKFLWRKGWGKIDLGRGPGKRKLPKEPRSWHDALMGVVIGDVIEDLYNKELWRDPKTLRDKLEKKLVQRFNELVSDPEKYIDWIRAPDKDDMLTICRNGVFGFLTTMKEQKLVGKWAKSEYAMQGYINPKNPVWGKCDIIFRRNDTGLSILDGKNSVNRLNLAKLDPLHYVQPDQLIFYALLHFLKTGEYADRLGFVYYRYPYDEEGNESGILWVPYEKEQVNQLAQRAVKARAGMFAEKFDPIPRPKVCRYCDFEGECAPRQEQRKANAAKRKKGSKTTVELKIVGGVENDGFEEFGFENT